MRNHPTKLKIAVIMALFFTSTLAFAQQPSGSQQLSKVSNTDIQPLPDSMNDMEQSYAEMAALNQEIEFAKRKLVARGLQNDLDKMRLNQEQKNLGFSVASIEGFEDSLFASIITDNGGVFHVQPGGAIGQGFKVSRITPSEVQVTEFETGKTYVVPFFRLPINKDDTNTNSNETKTVKAKDQGYVNASLSSSSPAVSTALNK